ncbi:hypothetical protein BO82DRAFT_425524 [Aspergillus uvarum CBS 121591]|uniref:Bys1 family protein n=1 Tax=Aspergillus uvarum CBS 121591 TaxID=1448315 RepID=A0A319CLY4_9EURO|nr:hypothetical protein BO82DRAFT_425524 [Aspergillus uvarum CBS 121591]PYH85001.1 hypothetical protein BO82DRAFT_425524 [Aspergillus uvarum CBS 121591]
MHLPTRSFLPLLTLTTATASPTPLRNQNQPKPANATITNQCPFPIYLTAVSSSSSSSTTPPEILLASNASYTQPYHHDPHTGGISLKLTTIPNGLYTGAAQTIFAYSYLERTGQVWFDLSDVFGDPFKGFRVRLGPLGGTGSTGGNGTDSIVWEDGVPPRGSQVRVVGCEVGLGLGVCV